MTVTLGSNIAALRGIRQLDTSSAELRRTFERLSSGQRINRASDDAAGLAIADSLRASSRVFGQGVRNFNDGLSLLSIADSALENLSSIVVRLQELAEQSANGVYSSQQRVALDGEAQALSDEYTRIIDTTEFNGVKLLNGELGELRLQGGFGLDGSLAVHIGDSGPRLVGTGSFGAAAQFAVGDGPFSVASGDFNGDGVLDLVTADVYDDAVSVLLGLGDGSFGAATQFGVGNGPHSLTSGDFNGDGVLDLVTADAGSDTVSVLLGLGNGSFGTATSFATGGEAGSIATGYFNEEGALDVVTVMYSYDAVSVLLGQGDGSFGAATQHAVGIGAPESVAIGDFNGDGVLDLVTANSLGSTASVLIAETQTQGSASAIESLDPFFLKSILASRSALTAFKQTLSDLSAARGNLGAFQSRVSVAISNLEVGSENFLSAEARIRDADIAEESSQVVRLGILQQSAASVLAQANQQPALALQLLARIRQKIRQLLRGSARLFGTISVLGGFLRELELLFHQVAGRFRRGQSFEI